MATKFKIFSFLAAFVVLFASAQISEAQSSKGLKTVVIDPGHGGHDPGALGLYNAKTGYHEKDVVLAISLLLGEKIEKAYPDVKVMYTRKTDVFISRNDRAKMANTYADLFISIHCNGSKDLSASGASVHILGPKSKKSNNGIDYFAQNQDVAQRRNNLMVVDGEEIKQTSIDASQTSDHISSSLQWKAIYESSLLFATYAIEHMIKPPLRPRSLVLDQEVVDVLAYTSRPAVLLEIGFVTNSNDYNYLKTAKGQEEIAENLLKAFAAYKPVYDSSFDIDFDAITAEPLPPADEPEASAESVESDVYYGIQIMAGSNLLKSGNSAFKGHDVHAVKTNDIYKYIIGKHSCLTEAQENLSSVRKSFPGAFVVKVAGNMVTRP